MGAAWERLGIEGDVEGQVKRMTRDGTPYIHERATLRHGRFIMEMRGSRVMWLGLADHRAAGRKIK